MSIVYLLNDRDDMQKAAAQIDAITILANILIHSNELETMYPAHSVLVKEVNFGLPNQILSYLTKHNKESALGSCSRFFTERRFKKGSD